MIWHEILAKEEGIYSEKTCAFSFATLEKLVKSGIIKKNEKIIIPITGSGLKGIYLKELYASLNPFIDPSKTQSSTL